VSHLLSPPSQRGQEPGPHGPQRSVGPLREAQTDPRSAQREQTEDQDHQVLPQPHLERDLQIVRLADLFILFILLRVTAGAQSENIWLLLHCSRVVFMQFVSYLIGFQETRSFIFSGVWVQMLLLKRQKQNHLVILKTIYYERSPAGMTRQLRVPVVLQPPEGSRQGPPAVGGDLGLGPDQPQRLHGLAVLRHLGAPQAGSGRMVR